MNPSPSIMNSHLLIILNAYFYYVYLGASGDHVFTDMYTADEEDFASSHASDLDVWVFDKVKVNINRL